MLTFFARQLYLLAVGGSLAAYATAMAWGWPAEGVVLGWSVLVLATGIWLERVAPFHPRWARANRDVPTDASSAVVLIGLVDPLLKAVLPVAALALLTPRAAQDPGWFLGAAPLPVQIFAAMLWIEFSKYWSHRMHHQAGSLWWLHAMHHGSERLYWLNNFRFHPLNHAINTAVSLLPLLMLGAPKQVLLGAVALTQPVLMLQHLNADIRSGWLNWILSTNEVHRWHHSDRPEEANRNYGSATVLWDHVFGTYRRAEPGARPARIGLFADSGTSRGYPAHASYWQQLLSAFTPACCRA